MIALNKRALLPSARTCLSTHAAANLRPIARRESRKPPATSRVVAASSSPSTSNPSEEHQHHHQGALAACSISRCLLVAVDESAAAKRAVIFALDHLYRPGDVVHILHVVPRVRSPAAPSGALYYAPPLSCPEEAKEALERAARAFIKKEFSSLIADRALPAAALAVDVVHESEGSSAGESVGDVILRTADELDCAALVLLSHEKKRRLEEFIWGSVSKEVASRTKRPVVLVH